MNRRMNRNAKEIFLVKNGQSFFKSQSFFKRILLSAVSVAGLCAISFSSGAVAEEGGTLGNALQVFAQKNNIRILFKSEFVVGKNANFISGDYPKEQFLERLLAGTGLGYQQDEEGNIYITNKPSKDAFQKITLNDAAYYENQLGSIEEALEDDERRDNDAAMDFEEIVVTASRRAQNLQDVPSSISAINPVEFMKSGLTSIGDIIEYTPGFNINRGSGQRGRGSISARGVGQQGSTAVVAVYVDDIPMTSNSGFANGGSVFFDGLLGDLERVELIKGPQGTLFGATAIGGAVRYITKTPALEEIRGGGSINLSGTKNGGFNQIYSGYVSLPVIEDKLGITVSGFYEKNGGLVDRVEVGTGNLVTENADSSKNVGFSGDIFFQATEKLDIRVRALHQKIEFNGTSLVTISDLNKTPTYGEFMSDDQLSEQSTKQTYVSATVNYDFEAATLTASSSFVKYDIGVIVDYTNILSGISDQLQGNAPGTTTSIPFSSPISSTKYIQEVRLTSQDSDSFEWIVGLYHANESSTQDQLAIAQPGDFLLALAAFPSKYKEYAAFANFTYYVTPEFDLTVGMRYADTSMELRFVTDGPLLGGASDEFLPTAKADIQTYLFTARYRPTEDMSLYARIASGYRPASANLAIYDPFTGELLTKPVVEQDNLWSYEIGAKGKLADGMFSYDMSLWYLDWSNFQAGVSFSGVSSEGNAKGGITAKGFEGTFTFRPMNGFSMISTVAYTHSTLNEDEPELNGLKGQFAPAVPRWTASTRAKYDFDISSDMSGYVGAGLRYAQGAPSAFDDGDLGDSIVNMMSDSFVLADFNAGILFGDVTLNFYVTNLFDKKGYANVRANIIPGATEVPGQPLPLTATGTPLRPRTIGAVLSFDF